MVYGCGNKCVKALVFIFNFLVFVVGVVILGVSLGIRFNNDIQEYFQKIVAKEGGTVDLGTIYIPLYVLMAIGSLLILTGFLGCCGAWTESPCLLAIFFAIILILFIAELACGIAVLVKKDEIKTWISDQLTKQLKDFDNLNVDQRNATIAMEQQLKCCGCTGQIDYGTSTKHPICPLLLQSTGCCDKIWNDIQSKLAIVGGVSIGILVIELLAMIFSCILCQAFKRGDYHYA